MRPTTRPHRAADAPIVAPSQLITRQTVASATLDAIRRLILHGDIAAGEALRHDALAERLGVSRMPVREALRQLEAEGLVTFYPHRGAVVATLSVDEIGELFEVRALLEPGLLRRAVPRIDKETTARARDILEHYDTALRRHEVSRWGELNWQFHATLYAPADRPRTMAIVENLHRLTDRYARAQLALTHGESRADEEHRTLLSLAARHDARAAATFLRGHILRAATKLAAYLRAQRATP